MSVWVTTRRSPWRGRWLRAGVAATLSLCALPAAASAALSSVADNDWVTNGPVYALARSGSTLYLGGSFSEVRLPSSLIMNACPSFERHQLRNSFAALGCDADLGMPVA